MRIVGGNRLRGESNTRKLFLFQEGCYYALVIGFLLRTGLSVETDLRAALLVLVGDAKDVLFEAGYIMISDGLRGLGGRTICHSYRQA